MVNVWNRLVSLPSRDYRPVSQTEPKIRCFHLRSTNSREDLHEAYPDRKRTYRVSNFLTPMIGFQRWQHQSTNDGQIAIRFKTSSFCSSV